MYTDRRPLFVGWHNVEIFPTPPASRSGCTLWRLPFCRPSRVIVRSSYRPLLFCPAIPITFSTDMPARGLSDNSPCQPLWFAISPLFCPWPVCPWPVLVPYPPMVVLISLLSKILVCWYSIQLVLVRPWRTLALWRSCLLLALTRAWAVYGLLPCSGCP